MCHNEFLATLLGKHSLWWLGLPSALKPNGIQGLIRGCGKGIDCLVNCHHTQPACWIYFNKQMAALNED